MQSLVTSYKQHQFPPEIIQYAFWIYYWFNLSHRDIEDLLAQRGIVVTHESIRLGCNRDGQAEELHGRAPGTRPGIDPRPIATREQPGRTLPPADPGAGTEDEAIQIDASGATIRPRARCRRKSLQSGPPFGGGGSLSAAAPRCVQVLGLGSDYLRAIRWAYCGRLKFTWPCQPEARDEPPLPTSVTPEWRIQASGWCTCRRRFCQTQREFDLTIRSSP